MKKYGTLVIFAFLLGFISVAFSSFKRYTERINCTELNGNGCVCHGVEMNVNVRTWVTGPQQLEAGQTGIYRAYLAGGPALGGGYNVAVRFGSMSAIDSFSVLVDNELTQAMPLVFPTPADTLYWDFAYTAPDSACIDTIYSCGLSTNHDGAPDVGDYWSFGPKFPVTIIPKVVPVELLNFDFSALGANPVLTWSTATEQNNKEFIIESSTDGKEKWSLLRVVPGKGTTTSRNDYSINLTYGTPYGRFIRLLQIDFNGDVNILKTISTSEKRGTGKDVFAVYPNPVKDNITLLLPDRENQNINISIFDLTGREILSENRSAGTGERLIQRNISRDLESTGIYIIRITTDDVTYSKKILFLK
ncbi:MAG: T9SS type A sorting domain-containing protein [Ignavibacteriaceae bacterium]|nr:T9SS type A sorting domain-containing protein [Ignavibacteriaceae bacterium]